MAILFIIIIERLSSYQKYQFIIIVLLFVLLMQWINFNPKTITSNDNINNGIRSPNWKWEEIKYYDNVSKSLLFVCLFDMVFCFVFDFIFFFVCYTIVSQTVIWTGRKWQQAITICPHVPSMFIHQTTFAFLIFQHINFSANFQFIMDIEF